MAFTRVGLCGPSAAYGPFVTPTLANDPAIVLMSDARLRGSALTTPAYQALLTLDASSIDEERLKGPNATDARLSVLPN